MSNRANIGRGLFILGMAIFFGYRFWQFSHPIYIVFLTGLTLISGSSIFGWLPTRWQSLTINLGISLVFLDFVFAEINLAEVWTELVEANYWMLIPAVIMVFVHLYFRTLRAQWLMKPLGDVTFWPTYRALVIGIAGNTVLPARAGEFLRAYVLSRSTKLSGTGIFATIVVERIFDGLTVLLFLLVVVIFGVRDPRLQIPGALGAAFYIGALVALVIFILRREWVDNLIKARAPEDLAKIVLELLDSFGKGIEVLRNPQQLRMVTFWNFWTWIVVPISFLFVLLAFDFGAPIPWQAYVLMLPALGIALSIPGPPGGVGLFHTAVVFTLNLTMPTASTFPDFDAVVRAASIVLHLAQFGPEVIVGVIAFMYEGLSTDDIRAGQTIAKEVEE